MALPSCRINVYVHLSLSLCLSLSLSVPATLVHIRSACVRNTFGIRLEPWAHQTTRWLIILCSRTKRNLQTKWYQLPHNQYHEPAKAGTCRPGRCASVSLLHAWPSGHAFAYVCSHSLTSLSSVSLLLLRLLTFGYTFIYVTRLSLFALMLILGQAYVCVTFG